MIDIFSSPLYGFLITIIPLLFTAYTIWFRKQEHKRNIPHYKIEPLFEFLKNVKDIKPLIKLKITPIIIIIYIILINF